MTEQGYAGPTVDDMMRRAGIRRTTIYRCGKDRESLFVVALTDSIAVEPVSQAGS